MSFVFHDPSGKRWIRLRRALLAGTLAVAAVAAICGLTLLSNPQLPSLGLPSVRHIANFSDVPLVAGAARIAKAIPFHFRKAQADADYGDGPVPSLHGRHAAKVRPGQPLVFGFYVNWDPASEVSLRNNLTHMTHLLPEFLALADGRGGVTDLSDPKIIALAREARLPILAEINNYKSGGWDAPDLHSSLATPAARRALVDNIYAKLVLHKFAGLNIDFEVLQNSDRGNFVAFMRQLRVKLHASHLILTESVPLDEPAYDIAKLGQLNDYIVPMLYDEHYSTGVPGPVASQEWFEHRLDQLAMVLPPEKTVIGFGNYGYDWTIGSNKGAAQANYSDTIAAAENNNGTVTWDGNTENPVLHYKRGSDQHEVWFLDATAALNQVLAVSGDGFRGVALWRLGSEDPGMWDLFPKHAWPVANHFDASPLFKLTAQSSVQHYGTGEVLRLADRPHDGTRTVWKSKSGDFAERYLEYPAYYVIEHPGDGFSKEVSLTFDDGPSAYTAQVLDILQQKQVSATFFVIGTNAERYPSLVTREYAEGNTIGNHTYYHTNIANESAEATKLELTATLRLIEHDTQHGTILFRPPYNADSDPQTVSEIVPIDRADQLGYITIAERVDPRDWEHGSTVKSIVNSVMAQRNDGRFILLHDGGGDRSMTVKALPIVIDQLRAKGYKFVPIEQLLERSRDEIMPVPSAGEMRWASIEALALGLKSGAGSAVAWLLLVTIGLTALRSLAYGTLAVIQKRTTRDRAFDPAYRPSVSVLVPAYNEEKLIESTVRSILENGYEQLEVVVVDDGSRDGTLQVLQHAFAGEPRVTILTQPNGGKASALNHAIAQAKHEILIGMDADTMFRAGTIEKLVRHFADPRVGAVSGTAHVGNRKKWIARFQAIEYVCSFNLDRRALEFLNAITVVPGAVGAWRKSLVVAAGGYSHDTLAEDTDLTIAIRRLGYEIRYEHEAVAYTEAPESMKALTQQRFRWAFGTLQAAWKHRAATFNPKYGYLGMVSLPSIWIFQMLLAGLSPVAELAMLLAILAGSWPVVALYYFGLFALDLVTALVAYALGGENPRDLMLLFPQRIYYRQLMYFVVAKSIVHALRGRLVGWGKLERTATVALTFAPDSAA